MVKLTTKVLYGDDIRRLTFENKPTYEELFKLLADLYKTNQNLHDFTIKYVDDENDHISLTNDREVVEAWNLATNNDTRDGTLRLVLTPNTSNSAVKNQDLDPIATNTSQMNNNNVNVESTFKDNPGDVNACVNKIISDVGNANPNLKPLLESNDVQNLIQQYQPLIQQFMPTLQQLASNGFNPSMNNNNNIPNNSFGSNPSGNFNSDPVNAAPNFGNLFAQFLPMFANMMPPPNSTAAATATATTAGNATSTGERTTDGVKSDLEEKLNELENMGFMDRELNEKILEQHNGDLGLSIQILLAL